MWRRRSPSVISARQPAVGVDHADAAEALLGHHQQRVAHRRLGRDQRQLAGAVHQVADGAQHGAQLAAGWKTRKSLAVKPRRSSRATASASPSAICRVVEVVGALSSPVASGASASSSTTSAARPSALSGAAVMRDQRDGEALGVGERCRPARAPRRTWTAPGSRRSAPIMPRSPWLASAGWTNMAGEPVEARVAAILRATWPDLPMPVQTIRPLAANSGLDGRGEGVAQAVGHAGQGLGLGRQHAAADGDGVEVGHCDSGGDRLGLQVGAGVAGAGRRGAGRRRSRGAWRPASAGVRCTGAWPNGPGERSPRPCGQTRARAITATAARPSQREVEAVGHRRRL